MDFPSFRCHFLFNIPALCSAGGSFSSPTEGALTTGLKVEGGGWGVGEADMWQWNSVSCSPALEEEEEKDREEGWALGGDWVCDSSHASAPRRQISKTIPEFNLSHANSH